MKKTEDELIRPYMSQFKKQPPESFNDQDDSPLHEAVKPTNESTPNSESNTSPPPSPQVTVVYVTPTPQDIHISENELWEALSTYRQSHTTTEIEKSESLCRYARERAQELYTRIQSNPENPLDNHEGFSRDADSGYVFEVTGFNTVGENLAYTPGYTSAVQIIEWGWDTSPGHRSLQLSNDITHGCISGIHPIYVGIYTY